MTPPPDASPARDPTWVRLGWLALFAVLLWTSYGHHRLFLHGDPTVNLMQSVRLERSYLRGNLQAWQLRRQGVPAREAGHVRLLEGGFAVYLMGLRQLGDRVPFIGNALLLPFLLMGLAHAARRGAGDGRAGRLALLLTLAVLLGFARPAFLIWRLVLPYRDTLSHTLGFAALAAAYAAARHPRRAVGWALAAGLLTGASGWSRLSGFFFVFPVGMVFLAAPGLGPWSRRFRLGLVLGCGVGVFVGLLLGQNLFEGRRLLSLPQGDRLMLQERPLQEGGEIRKGWHPVNIPLLLPPLLRLLRTMFPDWVHVLGGLAVLGAAATGRFRRLLPLLTGTAAFLAFYACYDKVVSRYSIIFILFYGAAWAVALASFGDGLAVRASRRGRTLARLVTTLAAFGLAGFVVAACLRSGPAPRTARDQWHDARDFQAWMTEHIPDDAHVMTVVPALAVWRSYFGPSRPPFPRRQSVFRGGPANPPRPPLPPDVRTFYLCTYREDPDRPDRGWTIDVLDNRFDLAPVGPPLPFRSMPFAGVRLFEIVESRTLQRTVEVRPAATAPAPHLLLHLRDLRQKDARLAAELRHPDWPRPWPVRLRPGLNLLAVPADLAARPDRIVLHSEDPLPTVADALWTGDGSFAVPFRDPGRIATQLLLLDNVGITWGGYPFWWRDWGSFSDAYLSWPRVVLTPETRIRLPHLHGIEDRRVIVRLYLSALGPDQGHVHPAHALRLEGAGGALPSLTVRCGPEYANPAHEVISDFMVEAETGPLPEGHLTIRLPVPPDPTPELIVLHQIDLRLESVADIPAAPSSDLPADPAVIDRGLRPGAEETAWMTRGFRHVPWPGYRAKPAIRSWSERIREASGILLAEGPARDLWNAYGHPATPLRDLLDGRHLGYEGLFGSVDAWLEEGRPVYTFDTLGGGPLAARMLGQGYTAVPEATPSAAGGAGPFAPALARVRPWSGTEVVHELTLPSEAEALLRIHPGLLWREGSGRTYARLRIGDGLVRDLSENGPVYVRMPPSGPGPIRLVLESDAPVPDRLAVTPLAPSKPLVVDLRPQGDPPHFAVPRPESAWALGPERSTLHPTGPASLHLPFPWSSTATAALVIAELEPGFRLPAPPSGSLWTWPARKPVTAMLALLPDPAGEDHATLPAPFADGEARGPGIRRLTLQPLDPAGPWGVDIGVDGDERFLGPGFHGAERHLDRTPFRWTAARAEVLAPQPGPAGALTVRLVVADDRPFRAPDAHLEVRVDGQVVEGRSDADAAPDPFRIWTGRILAETATGFRTVEIRSRPWTPAAVGPSRDDRELGVMLRRVEIRPGP